MLSGWLRCNFWTAFCTAIWTAQWRRNLHCVKSAHSGVGSADSTIKDVPYTVLHKISTLGYFQGSLECEVFIHHTAMKKFTNLFEMKINNGMTYLFWECRKVLCEHLIYHNCTQGKLYTEQFLQSHFFFYKTTFCIVFLHGSVSFDVWQYVRFRKYSLACPGIHQSAPISALIKPIGLCGTQFLLFLKQRCLVALISAKSGALRCIPGHADIHDSLEKTSFILFSSWRIAWNTLDPFKNSCIIAVANPPNCLNWTNFVQECPSLYFVLGFALFGAFVHFVQDNNRFSRIYTVQQ